MLKYNLQHFGGRGASAGGATQLKSQVDSTEWKSSKGVHEMSVAGVGTAVITKATVYRGGTNNKSTEYALTVQNNRGTSVDYIMGKNTHKRAYSSLRAAQNAAKKSLKEFVDWKSKKQRV